MTDTRRGQSRQSILTAGAYLAVAACALTVITASARAIGDSGATGDVQVVETKSLGLFQALVDVDASAGVGDPKVIRTRAVNVDLAQLTELDPAGGESITFNLFDGVAYDGVVERLEPISADTSGWIGRLVGDAPGTFALVVVDGVVAANIHTAHRGTYQIRYVSDDVYVIRQVDPAAFPPCATDRDHVVMPKVASPGTDAAKSELHAPTSPDAAGDTRAPADPLTIDVLVVYTSLARADAGGTAGMSALVNLGVLQTNDAYYNSGVQQRLNLVYRGEVDYDEPGFIDTALDDVTYKRDGLLGEVHDLRGIYGADMVSLIIEDTSYCGLAWVLIEPGIPWWYNWTFSVVQVDCVAGPDWSFAHELGHNMACFHDRDNTDPEAPDPLYPWAYGYRFNGDSGEQFRTIMAYAPGTRIQHFSNPHAYYDGQRTGVFEGWEGEAYNARTMNRTATFMRDLREPVASIAWVDFSHFGFEFGTFTSPYNTLTEGVNAIPDGGTVAVKSGSSSGARTLTKSMLLRAYDGNVILGR